MAAGYYAPHNLVTGYGPMTRLYFDGKSESFPTWEIRLTNYLYTVDKGVHKAILQPVTGVDDDNDFEAKNKRAYAELVQVLDERSLQLIMSDAPDDGRNALKILKQHFASTEKPPVLKLYEELTILRMNVDEDVTDYIIRAERAATGLNAAGETITDNLVIAMILKGLPEEYKPFAVVHTQMETAKSLTDYSKQPYERMQAQKQPVPQFNTLLWLQRNMVTRQTTRLHNVCPVENLDTNLRTVAVKQSYTAHTVTNQDTLKAFASQRRNKQVVLRHQQLAPTMKHTRLQLSINHQTTSRNVPTYL